MQVFLYLFALIIFLGVLHAFIVLPIMLVVVAPAGSGGASHGEHSAHVSGATPHTDDAAETAMGKPSTLVTEINALSPISRKTKIAPMSQIGGGLDTGVAVLLDSEAVSSSV